MRRVFFSDIDGTLLDNDSYDYSGSGEGLELLKESSVPLVPVSGKTRKEVLQLCSELELECDFVFENGGGIAFLRKDQGNEISHEYVFRGEPPGRLAGHLDKIQKACGCDIIPVMQMSLEKISGITGLPLAESSAVREREASFPFILSGNEQEQKLNLEMLNSAIGEYGIQVRKGGHFLHLTSSGADKGQAVKYLLARYSEEDHNPVSGSAGDSENDFTMFEVTDRAFLVMKKNGSYAEGFPDKVIKTSKPGPEGFSEAVKLFLNCV